jgi:hypothetical protein
VKTILNLFVFGMISKFLFAFVWGAGSKIKYVMATFDPNVG